MSAMKRVFEVVDYEFYSVIYEDGALAVADTVGGTWECVRDEDQDAVNEFLNNYEGK